MYNKMLEALMKSKEDGDMADHPMSDMEKETKLSILNEIRDLASKAMGSKLDGLKKVSVMSDSPEGLEQGLEKAKAVVSPMEDGSPEEEKKETPDMEKTEESAETEPSDDSDPDASLSPQELEAKIAKLMELKKKFI